MRITRVLLAISFLFLFSPNVAHATCPGITAPPHPLAPMQQLTVSNSAVGLTLPTSGVVRQAIIIVETNPIRFRDDGTNPTASVGMPVATGQSIEVCGAAIASIKFIRTGADGLLSVSFYGD